MGVLVGEALEPDATESTDDGMDEEVEDAEEDEDELEEVEVASVAFLEPHWLSFLHWSWPSASLG